MYGRIYFSKTDPQYERKKEGREGLCTIEDLSVGFVKRFGGWFVGVCTCLLDWFCILVKIFRGLVHRRSGKGKTNLPVYVVYAYLPTRLSFFGCKFGINHM